MEVEEYGVLELWRYAAGVQTWRYRGTRIRRPAARGPKWGRGEGTGVWSFGALEVCCRRVDVAVLRYKDLELQRHATGLETWRYGDLELGRCVAGAGTWRHGEVWRSGAREVCCGPGDVEEA